MYRHVYRQRRCRKQRITRASNSVLLKPKKQFWLPVNPMVQGCVCLTTVEEAWLGCGRSTFLSAGPISNLSVLSKLLERLVARQLVDYLSTADLLPELQSAYCAHHSIEIAVLKVLGDMLQALDVAVLALLDLSAACWAGSPRTSVAVHSMSAVVGQCRTSWNSFAVFCRVQSLGQYCSFCIHGGSAAKVWAHHPTAVWTSLASRSTVDWI